MRIPFENCRDGREWVKDSGRARRSLEAHFQNSIAKPDRRLAFAGLLLAVFLFGCLSGNAEPASRPQGELPTLTTANQVHSLSSKEAGRRYPVHLHAVVTYFDPILDNIGNVAMFVHDASGCIYVQVPSGLFQSLPAGTLIDLRGFTDPGEFAPIVAQPQIKVIGFAGLPTNPARPSFARLLTGNEDGQWVEVEGVVHSIVNAGGQINLQLAMDDGTIPVLIGEGSFSDFSGLVDAKVRIRGNPGPLFDVSRHQMLGANIHCPDISAVAILERPPDDPFNLPVTPIVRLLQWDEAPLLGHRVHVQGRVTLQWPGESVCIRDATQGICAQTDRSTPLRNGELIDIAGFAKAEGSAPELTDAVFRVDRSSQAAPVSATPVTAAQALLGSQESSLIQVEGQLISRDLASSDTTLLLSSGKSIFKAVLPEALGDSETTKWKNGSVLRITGICSVQLDARRSVLGLGTAVPATFRVLMRSPADVVVLQRPSLWTPTHALVVLAAALAGTLTVLVWVVLLRKRVDEQTRLLHEQARLLRESEERFRHMALHDSLTGLATRLLLQERLDVALEGAKRNGTGLAVLMLDLDRFKEINDTAGHQAGDEVLRISAGRMTGAVRKTDTVARMGGDEFVILLLEVNDHELAETIAAKVVRALSVPVPFAGRNLHVSASVGVCTCSAGEFDASEMVKHADAALYEAKAHGRNRVEFFVARSVSL